jgi:mono/diheme cytochrome c family protein
MRISILLAALILTILPAQALTQKEQEAAGAILFRDKGCAYCHGKATEGTHKGPPLIDARKRLKPEQIAGQIKNGGQKMPAFGDSLSDEEVTNLVAWLRAKHRPVAPPAPTSAPVSNPEQ